jgi:hypothetical protein
VAATCSENEEDTFVLGDCGGSDTDDTDELLASKSRYVGLQRVGNTSPLDESEKQVGREGASEESQENRRPALVVTALTSGREFQAGEGQSHEEWMFGFSSSSARRSAAQNKAQQAGRAFSAGVQHPGMASLPAQQMRMDRPSTVTGVHTLMLSASHSVTETILQSSGAINSQRDCEPADSEGLVDTNVRIRDVDTDGVQVQRIQHSPSSKTTFKFSNVLPPVIPDFKLQYM